MRRIPALALVLSATAALAAVRGDDDPLVLEAGFHHLGDDPTPEWPEAPTEPTAGPLVLRFEAEANAREHVLSLRQRHVNNVWRLELNGREVAQLVRDRGGELIEEHYVLPPGSLRDGENVLRLVGDSPADDITVGELRLHRQTLHELFDVQPVTLRVVDADGAPLPARITVVREDGGLARLFEPTGPTGALPSRDGVLYVGPSRAATVGLSRGTYTVHAGRGTEWSHAEARLTADGPSERTLSLRRELDTTGFIAVDTHLHTYEVSGHGDATLLERAMTLAGDGVELAIATDHNHNVDYTPYQRALGLSDWYTPVVGNEVTTPIGHFNAFPLDADDEVPLHDSRDWAATVADMRAHGARCVILNHPRWPAPDTGPFGVEGLDILTGARATGAPFDVDAMELVNSTTEEESPRTLLEQWFALLGRGEGPMGVGSSDSHTVGDPTGRGRTYVVSASDDPADLDVPALAEALAAGHSSVSLGLFVDVRQGARSVMGHTLAAGPDGSTVELEAVVRAPSWARPERLEVYVNGRLVQNEVLAAEGALDHRQGLVVPLPAHDAYVVVVAWGADAGDPWWPGLHAEALAIANPVFVDVDGDGRWSSPRDVARAALQDPPRPLGQLDLDEVAGLHYLDLSRDWLRRDAATRLRELAGEPSEGPLKAYLDREPRDP